MTVNNTYSFFFSPTGGTKKIASLFGSIGTANPVDITSSADDIKLSSDCLAVFAVPSYGGRIPSPVYERINHIEGSNTPCVILAVFGNRAVDDAGLEISNLVKKHGFKVIGYGEFVAPHSVNRKFAYDRPDAEDIEKISQFRKAVEDKLLAGSVTEISVPGNEPYREYNGIPLKPKADKSCTGCGKCASFCPAEAINISGISKTDTAKCISCMGCIEVCPVHARSIPWLMKLIASSSLKKFCKGRKESSFTV